jgi:RNA polymerase sigma-70 factor, ECF subfamily
VEVSVEQTFSEDMNSAVMCAVDPDLCLVEATRRGDAAAFEELVRKYDRKLFRITQNVIHNAEDAQEVVQTAFFKAFRNLHRFQGNAKFSTWLIRIALNEAIGKVRKQSALREQSIDSDPYAERDGEWSDRLPVDLTDWAPSPESIYSAAEFRKILKGALQKLRPTLRAVFVLRDIEEHSILETSGILNLSPTAVKARLFRARLQLREELSLYFKKREKPAVRFKALPS